MKGKSIRFIWRKELVMVKKYQFGTPFETEAVVQAFEVSPGIPETGKISTEAGFLFQYEMSEDDIVYGLGEANRGINKRGYRYVSLCADDPHHTEDKVSLYGAHNFIILSGERYVGLFFDYPAKLTFDIGYTRQDTLSVQCDEANLYVYELIGNSAIDIVRQFRKMIGKSYIPPKFAFGYGQSRWGYKTRQDFEEVVKKYRDNHIPMDMLYMDIDYMEQYKDFTVNPEEFADFEGFVQNMKSQNIHPVPIIDAGVKIEPGYDIYEEGVQKGYFCKKEDGTEVEIAVWPGLTHLPDVLNKEAREWFGSKYEILTSKGIDAFWNDMNEPAIFYTKAGLEQLKAQLRDYADGKKDWSYFELTDAVGKINNNVDDYKTFYHNVNGQMIRHDKVHNLYGYNMTRAAGEAFEKISPDKRILMFSRSSYIGMHRYGGVWMGDNQSWWNHILLNLKMMVSLNMCGFLYTGADLGGFGSDTTRDLLLRWLALGVFTPLMRNHSALGTREQECYQFEGIDDFKHIIEVRYRLIPYLYSEYMKAVMADDMYARPLAFEYTEDKMARTIEDQVLIGNEIMIAPVYEQNAVGRYVYLPEEMMFIKFMADSTILSEVMEKGIHYVEVALNEVPLFIRKDKKIPIVDVAESVPEINMDTLQYLGYENATYSLYNDDGISRIKSV